MADSRRDGEEEGAETWRETVAQWGPAILAVIFIRLFLFEPFRIPSGSMVPTLLIGDFVLVSKFSYGVWMPWKGIGVPFTTLGLDDLGLPWRNSELIDLADPERGDVIVFHFPKAEDLTYIKRVVGLPGDRIRVQQNQIVLNGELQKTDNLGVFVDHNDRCAPRQEKLFREALTRTDGQVVEHGTLTHLTWSGPLSDRAEIVVPPDHVFVMGDNRDNSEDSRAWGFVREDQIKGKAHLVWLSWDGCGAPPVGTPRLDRMFRSLYRSDDLADLAEPASGG